MQIPDAYNTRFRAETEGFVDRERAKAIPTGCRETEEGRLDMKRPFFGRFGALASQGEPCGMRAPLGPLTLNVVEGFHARVLGLAFQLFLDADELVVLGHAVGPARAPVLIWPVLQATDRSAMVTSSVSPERWLMTQA